MISFEKLVEKVLVFEATPPPLKLVKFPQFMKNNSVFQGLTALFNSTFDKFNYQTDVADPIIFDRIINRANYISSRPTGAEESFKRVEKALPMLDFLTYFSQEYYKSYKDRFWISGTQAPFTSVAKILDEDILARGDGEFDETVLQQITQTFINEFKLKNPSNQQPKPDSFRSYKPITTLIQDLQAKYFGTKGSDVIGKIALKNYDNASIKKAIYGLLEARKIIRQKQIKDKKIPNAVKFIDDVLLNYQKFAGGKNMVPSEFKEMYQDVHVVNLVEIAKAADDLYQSEVNRNNNKLPTPIQDVYPDNVATTLDNFLQNNSQNNFFVFNYKTSQSQTTPIEVQDVPGGYTIKNIREVVKTIPESKTQAETLIQKLEQFANYIRQETEKDIPGALRAGAGALSSLSKIAGPTMGKR